MITNNARFTREIESRIAMAEAVFNRNKTFRSRGLRLLFAGILQRRTRFEAHPLSLCEIYGEKSDTERGFPPSNSPVTRHMFLDITFVTMTSE